MSIYWKRESALVSTLRRWWQPALIGAVGAALLNWSPVWLIPTRLGLMLTLLLYMTLAYGMLWWALRRLQLPTKQQRHPFITMFLVSVYLTVVAVSLVPIMQALSSSEVSCQQQQTQTIVHHTCTGYFSHHNLEWGFSGETRRGLPFIWMTTREFDASPTPR